MQGKMDAMQEAAMGAATYASKLEDEIVGLKEAVAGADSDYVAKCQVSVVNAIKLGCVHPIQFGPPPPTTPSQYMFRSLTIVPLFCQTL
jgi:hypothetical protein